LFGTIFDGAARHTPEGFAFQARAAEAGFKAAVRDRDEPFDGPRAGAAGESAGGGAAESPPAPKPPLPQPD
jgi:hypothetical protein